MKRIGTGAGLVALGASMITSALLLTRGNSGAFAQNRDAAVASHPDADAPTVAAVVACGAQAWFDLTPRRISLTCDAPLPLLSINAADVNGDGIIEQFPWNAKGSLVIDSGPVCYPNGNNSIPPLPMYGIAVENMLVTTTLGTSGAEVSVGTSSVLSLPASFGESLKAFLPSPGYPAESITYRMFVSDLGWFDCDSDGDLDLILILKTESRWKYDCCNWWCGYFNPTTQSIWLENVAHGRPDPVDLDGNGVIDGGDMALLLLNWTN